MNGEILDTSAVKSDDVLENYPLAENGKTLHQTIFQRCKEKAPQSFKIYHNLIAFLPVTILRMSLIKMKVNLISPEF